MYNINEEKFEVVELLGKTALFTEDRLSDDIIPKGLYKYELREGNDDSDTFYFSTLEKHVYVDHGGTVLTLEPIALGSQGYIDFTVLDEDDVPGFDGTYMTIDEYIKKYSAHNVYVILQDETGRLRRMGIQIDGGKAAQKYAEEKGYKLQMWNMGNKEHLYQLSDDLRSEIRSAIKKASRESYIAKRKAALAVRDENNLKLNN